MVRSRAAHCRQSLAIVAFISTGTRAGHCSTCVPSTLYDRTGGFLKKVRGWRQHVSENVFSIFPSVDERIRSALASCKAHSFRILGGTHCEILLWGRLLAEERGGDTVSVQGQRSRWRSSDREDQLMDGSTDSIYRKRKAFQSRSNEQPLGLPQQDILIKVFVAP